MKNKGYVMTWDSILALIFVIMVFVGLIGMEHMRSANVKRATFLELHSTAENSMGVMDKKGVLEDIVTYSSDNRTQLANDTASFYLEQVINERIGYRLAIGNETVCENQRVSESRATEKTKARRFVTGPGENQSSEYIARAWLLYNDTDSGKRYSIANVTYGRGFWSSEGCEWTIEYINSTGLNEEETLSIPSGYSGGSSCSYTSSDYSAPGGGVTNDAIYRLLNGIDRDPDDGVLEKINGYDYNFTSMSFEVNNVTTPSITETKEVNLILWLR